MPPVVGSPMAGRAGGQLILTAPAGGPTITCFSSGCLVKASTYGSPEATNLTCSPRQTAQPSPCEADSDPVLCALQRAGIAAPRLSQLRSLSGPGSRGDGRGEVSHADCA